MACHDQGLAQVHSQDADRVNQPQALGAVGDVDRVAQVDDQQAHDLAKAQRDHRQVVTAQPQRGRPQQYAQDGGQRRAQRDGHPPGGVQPVREQRRDSGKVVGQVR